MILEVQIHIITISMVLMLLFAVSVVCFLLYAQKKIAASQLRAKDLEIKHQMELLEHTVRIQEDERYRIASELHDDVTSQLNIVHLFTSLLKDKVPKSEETDQLIDKVNRSLQNSIERTRAMSHQLMPMMLKKFGIRLALKELVDHVNLSEKLKIKLSGDDNIALKDDYRVLHLYRIIQELINNTMKYAKAQNINIQFSQHDDQLHLVYTDDGIGIKNKAEEGLGFKNMKTRAKLLDGTFALDKDYSNGVKFNIQIPNNG